jgi:dTDP-4-amino-4,6-dideoxygalactose transaminase
MGVLTNIPLVDLTRFDVKIEAELNTAFAKVLRSGLYIMGPELAAFEAECTELTGTKHAIGVSSGTDALLLAMMTLGIGPGDEVICPSFTFFATAGCVWRLGAKPVFVDSSLKDFNLLADAVEGAITPRTKAIIPVHLFGQCVEMDPLLQIAHRVNVPIIEDAAQAIGAAYRRHQSGSMGSFGCFSFFPTKNLGALGDGGLVTTNDDALAKKARVLRVHGGEPKYLHSLVGGNFRLDALQAALLRIKLKRLDHLTEMRQENAKQYCKRFAEARIGAPNHGQAKFEAPILYPIAVQARHTYNQFVIRVAGQKRDSLRNYLSDHKIGTEIYYPVPLHRQACFSSLNYSAGALPNAERLAVEVLALPIFPELTADEIASVVDTIAEFFRA